MDDKQFGLMMGAVNEIKGDVKQLRKDQVDQGKVLASVTTKVRMHHFLHKTTIGAFLTSFVGAVGIWLKSHFTGGN